MPSSSRDSNAENNNTNNNNNNINNDTMRASQYQSLPDANIGIGVAAQNSNSSSKYKGFSTSITHICTNPDSSRVDCCSIACCGLLQSDYNRYILHNRRPPTFANRLVQYILIPVGLFCAAGYAAFNVMDKNLKEMVVWMLLTMMIGWVLGGCFRATYRHAIVRRDLLRKVRGMSRGMVVDSQDEMEIDQTENEMMCVHRMCGCYGSDLSNEEMYSGRNNNSNEEEGQVQGDFLGCLSWVFSSLCCGRLCGCHWQICGICGVAQEGRQVDALVPVERRRLDYVTFQSYFDYMNDIRKLRAEKNGKLWDHYMALSKLSRMMLKTLFIVTLILSLFSVIVAPKDFKWTNMLVFVGTFLQAFLILYFVHWYWNRFDISLDAVIKYFACGFIITTSTAVCFELLESSLLKIALNIITYFISVEQDDEQNGDGYGRSMSFFDGGYGLNVFPGGPSLYSEVNDQQRAFQKQHPFVAFIFLFFSAYFIAALVEESCKYFGFKMVEHPDFVTDTDLENSVAYGVFDDDDDDEDRFECGGGLECGDEDDEDGEDFGDNPNQAPTSQTISSRFIDGSTDGDYETKEERLNQKSRAQLHECPPKSLKSTGAAITIAMVSVALGFACCENLIYIFLYNSGPLDSEIAVLISRSLFPVHPLCAAIQSINVCKQQLENDKSFGAGRIIFPAIMLHGSYDFSIMIFNFLSTLNEDDENNEEVENAMSLIYSLCAFVVSILFVIGGAVYYVRGSKAQNARLAQIDASRNFLGVV